MKKTLSLSIRWSSVARARSSIERVRKQWLVWDARAALRSLEKQLPEAPASTSTSDASCLVQLTLEERDVRYLASLIHDVPELARPLRAAYSN